MSKYRSLLLGTGGGIFRATGEGDAWRVLPVGLQGRGPVRALIADVKTPERLYAGTAKGGCFRSDDGGQSWWDINEGITYKDIHSIAQNPKTGELYVGTEPVAIFKSSDGGGSFSECASLKELPESVAWTFPRPPHYAHVRGLNVTAEGRIIAALEEGWLVRSTDGGESWECIKRGTCFDSHSVSTMPDCADVVFSTSGLGMFKSTDGGLSFRNSGAGILHTYLTQIAVHPQRPHVLVTAAAEVPPPWWFVRKEVGANSAIYRSLDQGESWTRITKGLPPVLKAAPRVTAVDPADPDCFFVGTFPEGGVWISEDGGESFRQAIASVPPVFSLLVEAA